MVIDEVYTDGKRSQWILGTSARNKEPLWVWETYKIRPCIEERHRQLKCFWDLTNFRSTNFALPLNQVAFVLLAYSLMQVFLLKAHRGRFTNSTRKRLIDELLPSGKKVFLYYKNRACTLDILEYQELLLTLPEGPRRRILGNGEAQKEPPWLLNQVGEILPS